MLTHNSDAAWWTCSCLGRMNGNIWNLPAFLRVYNVLSSKLVRGYQVQCLRLFVCLLATWILHNSKAASDGFPSPSPPTTKEGTFRRLDCRDALLPCLICSVWILDGKDGSVQFNLWEYAPNKFVPNILKVSINIPTMDIWSKHVMSRIVIVDLNYYTCAYFKYT